MAGETTSAIRSHILEESIVRGDRRSVRLERCDRTVRIAFHTEAINDWRNMFCAAIGILVAAHFLHVLDHRGSEVRLAGIFRRFLRCCSLRRCEREADESSEEQSLRSADCI